LRPAIEQPHTKRVLEVADRLRHRRLRDVELLSRLGHAAPLHDREKDVQIAQPKTSADPALPINRGFRHDLDVIGGQADTQFQFTAMRVSFRALAETGTPGSH
jgi:hypothetical protein